MKSAAQDREWWEKLSQWLISKKGTFKQNPGWNGMWTVLRYDDKAW